MNAANLIAESILNENYLTIILGEVYNIYPPTIKVLCRSIKEFSQVVESTAKLEVMSNMEENFSRIKKGIAYLIVGDCEDYEHRATCITFDCTQQELVAEFEGIIKFISPDPFSKAVSLAKNVAQLAAKQQEI